MSTFTLTAVVTDPVTGESATKTASFSVGTALPRFGFNYDIDGGLVAAATTLGCKPFTTSKIFNSSIPPSYPGHSGIPSAVVDPLVTIRVPITTASPWIASADQANLATVFASMPTTGTPMVTINNEAEGAAHGYTVQQIIGSHATAYNLFLANAPANAVYTQNLMTYSASPAGRGTNFHSWVFCKASGGTDLPIYFLDWYPTNSTTGAANSMNPAYSVIKNLVPAANVGVGECNYRTSSGVIYTPGQLQWFQECWTWISAANRLSHFIPYFQSKNSKPFPPADPNVTAELSKEAHLTGL